MMKLLKALPNNTEITISSRMILPVSPFMKNLCIFNPCNNQKQNITLRIWSMICIKAICENNINITLKKSPGESPGFICVLQHLYGLLPVAVPALHGICLSFHLVTAAAALLHADVLLPHALYLYLQQTHLLEQVQ